VHLRSFLDLGGQKCKDKKFKFFISNPFVKELQVTKETHKSSLDNTDNALHNRQCTRRVTVTGETECKHRSSSPIMRQKTKSENGRKLAVKIRKVCENLRKRIFDE